MFFFFSYFFFFFSSRRRHTRLTCDWSSDVCSSDLEPGEPVRGDAIGYEHMIGPLGERQRHGVAHARIFRRWKWCGPSLPPKFAAVMVFTPGRQAAGMPARIAASIAGASVPSSTISSTLFTPSGSWDGVIARSVGSNGSLVVATMFL